MNYDESNLYHQLWKSTLTRIANVSDLKMAAPMEDLDDQAWYHYMEGFALKPETWPSRSYCGRD